jgi:UDP-N-acetylglucosamine--N-acetylmuramyl-(pentapeptide) pyrophosphoryl-undecaprenol N-acetylglucosamine transferase
MIMAGGTGGHIFPGLAVAEVLREQQRGVVWLGTQRGLEARLVPERGIEIEWINIRGLRGRGWRAWIATPLQMLAAIIQVMAAFRRCRPSAVLGMGGFVSAPGGIAAWLTRRPLIIHEQNAVAGTANRLLAPLARQVYAAFPGAFPLRVKHRVVGNPVRREIAILPPPAQRFAARRDGLVHLLVVGGSQGARVLNEIVPQAIALLPRELRPAIHHQAGQSADTARAGYAAVGTVAEVMPFIEDMAAAYAWADLVVARAGALTVAELEAAGVGAILVPYPHAIDDHQTKNAEHFARRGAGVVLAEPDCSAARLAAELGSLIGDRDKLLSMAEQARSQALTDAAVEIARACIAAGERGAA